MKALIAAVVLLATPLAAQDRMTERQCKLSFDAVRTAIDVPVSGPIVQLDDDNWCAISDVNVAIDPGTGIRIASLRWRTSDIGRFINDGLPPRMIEVQGRGLGVIPVTGDAVLDYLLQVQMNQMQMAFGATVRWDGLQNAVLLDQAFLEFDPTNRIEATARIGGANLTDMATIQTSLGTMGLRDLMLKSQFDGWFETYLVTIIGNILLDRDGAAPRVQVAGLKRQAIDFVSNLPDNFMPTPSRTALSDFINTLPTPHGSAQLQLTAQPILGAARLAPFAMISPDATAADVVRSNVDGVTVLFTWTPTGRPQ